MEITEPGVYDLPAEAYHADPVPGGSLSSTGARRLLEVPPARWLHEKANPPAPSPQMILGTAVHSLTLGAGPTVVEIDADDWRTKKAKEARHEALAAGQVPLLREDHRRAVAMAAAVLTHPIAAKLFAPTHGKPEQALIWHDAQFGVWRRAMVDHLPHDGSHRPILVDLKTTADAGAAGKTAAKFGYDQQAAFYLDGYEALFPGRAPGFLFVFVESVEPHLVRIVELDAAALRTGAELNRLALEIYRDCREADDWPGYPHEPELVSLPPWAETRHLELTP